MVGIQPEGMDVRSEVRRRICWRAVVVAAWLLAIGVEAWGQARDNEIRVTILDVGYNSAYRNGTWVPVDVIVENEREDISGYLEVRTFWNTNRVQSPVYRVPVESPLHSRKRIRVHCLLNDTLRVEASLYERGRRVEEVPTWVDVTPIRPTDSLVLIMDEISGNYAFLYNVLQDASGERRVYRHELSTDELSDLPGYATCYEAFDLIVMSDIDPGRIGVRHRELLRDYVESGGVLVAGIGESANVYRGSWIEELLGARIGESKIVRDTEYAPLVLPAGTAGRANESRQYSVPTLEPVMDGVLVRGGDEVLATMRRVGSGAVVGLTVDGPSKALQDTEGYRDLWRDLAAMRHARRNLEYGQATQAVEQQLPWISGVRIQPKSTVMAYLGLYVLVGIVGNWLFWNRLKRREMAWVCLVFISIGFTAYAVTFGTIGRAKNSEISYIDVIEIPQGNDAAERHSLAGVLTAGTARYSGSLANEYALATEAARWSMQAMSVRRGPTVDPSPFTFVEGSPARVEDMRVGASELRLLHIEDQVAVPGGVEGALIHDESGLHGELINHTGFRLPDALLYYSGRFYALRAKDEGWIVELNPSALEHQADRRFDPILETLTNYGGMWNVGYGGNIDTLHHQLMLALMLRQPQGGQPSTDPLLGPFVMGWAGSSIEPSLDLDEGIPERMHDTLVIADVTVVRGDEASGIPIELPVQVSGAGYNQGRGRQMYTVNVGTSADVYISVPSSNADLSAAYGPLEIEIVWEDATVESTVYVRDPASGKLDETPVRLQTGDGQSSANAPPAPDRMQRYVIENWRRYVMGQQGQVVVSILPRIVEARPQNQGSVGRFSVRATVEQGSSQKPEGDWKLWLSSKPSN